ncbi:ubiquinone biosynthesis regulatory protein kinase UbiB [Gallaecimonas kandeliae]|uniref:ubiquinone biosynthesis regulatory protein kinase UbiB n=1 Tax=Gallaecimonas kandeliae TaxID=3029055 RepID=UPI0026497F60|nr:ubiquinone biosynthesis regulatory protein kinase UbiB [Gallaecimonas kandeliae]WKE65540.1 ubiquinone biosynthesis regulatory protein kinase UbiB [Gallaecimonas kandeliae]
MSSLRLHKVLKTLLNHGIDELVPRRFWPWYMRLWRLSLFWIPNRHKKSPRGQRLRLAFEALGPVYIKFGQMLSTRRDLLPDDVALELAKLQDRVPPFDGAQARASIERSLGGPLEHWFTDFDEKPLASASIAQVHTARLKDSGQEVVLKVIRPGIQKVMAADVSLMGTFAALAARLLPDGRRLRPKEVVKEYQKTLFDELDLLREAANAIQLRRNFEGSDSLYVPEVYPDLCRKRLLVMERIYGIPVADIDGLKANGTNLERLAEKGVEVFFTQVFRDSFFHADMHPGNIFVAFENPQDPKYIGIDCGIVGTLAKEDKRYLAENFVAFFNRDYRKVAELHVDSGWVPFDTSVDEFEVAIRTVCEPIFEKPLAQISFGQVLVNLFNTARRFNMEVQPQLVLLQKTLLYIEGLGRQLYPELDLWKTAKPFLEDWLKEQMGPKAMFRHMKANLPFWGEKLPELPDLLYDNLRLARDWQQRAMLREQEQALAADRRSQMMGWQILAASLLISAAVLLDKVHWWLPAALALGALVSWIKALRK